MSPAIGAIAGLQLALCLVAFVGLSLWEMGDESATYDEGPHLSAAYTALVRGDYRLVVEQPPLARRIGALPLLFDDVRLPGPIRGWEEAEHFQYGFVFLFQSGNDADRLLLHARLAMLSWGVLLVVSVFAVARHLFGSGGGLVALVATAFNPNILAHAHLVTTDVAPAALVLLSVVAFQLWLERAGAVRAAMAGVLTGGAVAAKFSCLALVPVLTLQLGWWGWRARRGGTVPVSGVGELGAAERARRLGELALVVLLAYATVWGAYDFRYAISPDPSYAPLSHLRFGPPLMPPLLRWSAAHRLLPEAFLVGLTELGYHAAAGHPGFALGLYSQNGWWWYLPFAFLVKSPVALLILAVLGAVVWFRERRTLQPWGVAMGGAAAVFTAAAMASPLAMGVRHLFLAFPFVLVACGAAVHGLPGRGGWRVGGLALLNVTLMTECLAASPYHLSYFNGPTLALARRPQVLTDSNLDWGQDLKRLKRYMDAHGISEVKLAYFGMASPRQLGLRHQSLISHLSIYPQFEPEWPSTDRVAPGDFVALSVFCSVAVPWLEASLPAGTQVVTSLGNSIVLYHLPPRPWRR